MKIKIIILLGFGVLGWTFYGMAERMIPKDIPEVGAKKTEDIYYPKPIEMAVNENITQDNMDSTICDGDGGWNTGLIRPSSSVTGKIKKQFMEEIKTKLPSTFFQLDHIIPLTIGGHPTSTNLVLQSIVPAHEKDKYEKYLWKQVCNGTVGLKEAQERIFTNWRYYYLEAGLNKLGSMAEVIDEDDNDN